MERKASKVEWIQEAMTRFQGPLLQFTQRMTGNLELARDVVQDAFLTLLHQDRARVEGHLGAWLFTVCRHRAVDLMRKEERMRPGTEKEILEKESPAPPPAELAEKRVTHAQVQQLIQGLSPKQQEVLRLKFQGGLSYKEISDVTGLTPGNVGVILHTAVKALRGKMRPAGAGRSLE